MHGWTAIRNRSARQAPPAPRRPRTRNDRRTLRTARTRRRDRRRGPAGLTAARVLAPRLGGDVLVLDREETAGGIPRHSDHVGYGIRDLHRMMSGPAYARRLASAAADAGAAIRTRATVTGWADGRCLEVTTPQGRLRIDARAVVLATGARERPRPARLIPGDRPAGVYTTGHLQNLVHLHHGKVGSRAVVVGGELVSWSALVTLREASCATVLMTTPYPSPESYAAFNIPGRVLLGFPVATRTRVTRIRPRPAAGGRDRGPGHRTAAHRRVRHPHAHRGLDSRPRARPRGGLDLDPRTKGPLVDTALRTSQPGVFAAGNLVHAVDTADVAALDGQHVADQVLAWLDDDRPPSAAVRIEAGAPFRWVAPGLVRPGDPAPPRHRLLLWTDELVRVPRVTIRQDGRTLSSRVLSWPASPGRMFRVPWSLMRNIDPHGGPVRVGLA